jgi:uncharacterized protein YcbK (DUF882 family)
MHRRSVLLSIAAAAAVAPLPALGLPAAPSLRRLDLTNAHTGERFTGPYRVDNGPIPDALKELAFFLRDFHCDQEIAIDVRVLDFLADVLEAVGTTRATVLSAYRTPATNAMLARTTFGVAENSQHLYGRALDIYLPVRLEEAMLRARAMQRGGVGWYPNSHFIHIDSGPVRNWTLAGTGFGRLLLGGKGSKYFPEPIAVSAEGEFVLRRSGRPLTAADRLSLHDLLQKAAGSLLRR